jgi:peptidoglycan lytic transglycosylase
VISLSHNRAAVIAWVVMLAGAAPARTAPQGASARLRALASRAEQKSTWNRLLRYAESQKDPEQKGLAYFVLGYREYDTDLNEIAASHFREAAETRFSLADFAEYYEAAAAREAGQPAVVVKVLEDFRSRYPASTLSADALELDARTLLDIKQPQGAIAALTADPRVRQDPSLAFLLASAYRLAGMPKDSARTYQEIYYAFPTSGEARAAKTALDDLRTELGGKLPQISAEIQTARADKLFDHSKYQDALGEYEALLSSNPAGTLVERWKLAQARCLYRLRRTSAALDEMQQPFPNHPALDAERLSTLVDIYARQEDSGSMDLLIGQLAKLYPDTPAYASALDSAGDYFVRQGNWQRAAGYYQPLAKLFPDSTLGLEANWRLAWACYLRRDYPGARAAFEDHLKRYPDSWHRAAALYWLARMAEEHRAGGAARKLYELVAGHYGQSYYASLSGKRLNVLAENRSGFDSDQAGDWADVSEVARQIPVPDAPSIEPCSQPPASPDLDRVRTLRSINLDDLAEQYLRTAASNRSSSVDLLLALSRMETEQGETAAALFDAVRAVNHYWDLQFDQLPKEVWNLLYPRSYWNLVRREAAQRRLDPYLVMGLIRQESAFNPKAVSVANARGLMQILPQTAVRRRSRRRAAARRLMSPTYNVRIGTNVLRQLSAAFDGNMEQAMAAYHAGQSRVSAWRTQYPFRDPAEFLETIPIPATRIYVERVMRDAAVYRKLLTGSATFANCRHRTAAPVPSNSTEVRGGFGLPPQSGRAASAR